MKRRKSEEKEEVGTITFSTRLTEEQRDRVIAAAEARGWSPSNLIRVAALEKAAHILNTTRQTRFDFVGLAAKIATQLVKPEAFLVGPDGQTGEDIDDLHAFDVSAEPSRLTRDELQTLKEGSRLGGAELLNLILRACESLTAPDRSDFPPPVDPA